jgi:hypothetical protein
MGLSSQIRSVNSKIISKLVVYFSTKSVYSAEIMEASEFSEIVRNARTKKFKTAKDFFRQSNLSCTYAYYSKVENGVLPEIEIALEIISKLRLNQRRALFAWTRDHMPSRELKALFSELGDATPLSAEQTDSSRSITVNRMQAKLLLEKPVYWEILVYYGTYFGKHIPTIRELSKVFSLSEKELTSALTEMYNFGLLDVNGQGGYVSKEWIYIPYSLEYRELRDSNFKRAFDQFLRSKFEDRFRTTVTCPLLPKHQKIIESKVLALSNEIIDLSEKEKSEGSIPYTIGIFSSPRQFGHG